MPGFLSLFQFRILLYLLLYDLYQKLLFQERTITNAQNTREFKKTPNCNTTQSCHSNNSKLKAKTKQKSATKNLENKFKAQAKVNTDLEA